MVLSKLEVNLYLFRLITNNYKSNSKKYDPGHDLKINGKENVFVGIGMCYQGYLTVSCINCDGFAVVMDRP